MKVRAVSRFRWTETWLLALVFLAGLLGFGLLTAGLQSARGETPARIPVEALLLPILVGAAFAAVHAILVARRKRGEQLILPVVALLATLGLLMIWRLRGPEGAGQQLLRGFMPGMLLVVLLALRPGLLERVRQGAIPISVIGLLLPIATVFFGVIDETGARLSLRIGPLPPIQPSELIKLSLIIFLAWFIDREGRAAEGQAQPILGFLRLPPLHYFAPGLLFVALAILALVEMSDYGAVLLLGAIFVGMLFAGFETRVFIPIAAIGILFALLAGLILSQTWEPPATIRYRFLAYRDPWSEAVIVQDGQDTGITIAEGPGYQIQQAVYAMIAGGVAGTGLGFGTPEYVPLAHSDFIFAAMVEELGSAVGLAVLVLFGVLMMRIARIALLLPRGQVFERLLLVGICIHFFIQVFVMVGGTLNLFPLTGVTIPFLSQGGVAWMVNLAEVGLALAVAQRLEVGAR